MARSETAASHTGAGRAGGGRVQARQIKTRSRLLRAAYDLMSSQGVDATTIQEITAAADTGFGTFYNYFQSKDDIAGQVLDCVIHNLGLRNDRTNGTVTIDDPVQVVSNSLRLVAREMRTNPVWHWWVRRPDLLVERMRAGFKSFGLRDLRDAVAAGRYRLEETDHEAAWSALIWLLAGGIKDLVDGCEAAGSIDRIAENVLRVMGVPPDEARRLSLTPLPPYESIPIDFAFTRDSLEAQG